MKTETECIDTKSNFNRICRLCLGRQDNFINIFDSGEDISLPLRIMACTSLEVQSTDLLPKSICRKCRVQLEKSYYFRKRCQQSDTKLRKHIRLLNAGKINGPFEPKSDEDDEDEFEESIKFLKNIEEEEMTKILHEKSELEESLKAQLRAEETERIFEEAKNYLNNKALRNQKFVKRRKQRKLCSNNEQVNQEDGNKKDCTVTMEEANVFEETSNQSSGKVFKFDYSQDEDTCFTSEYYLFKSDEEQQDEISNDADATEEVVDLPEIIEDAEIDMVLEENVYQDTNSTEHESKIEEQSQGECSVQQTDEVEESSNDSKINILNTIQKSFDSESIKLNNTKYKIAKVSDNITHVEVTSEEGNVFLMELQSDSAPSDNPVEKYIATNNEGLKIFKCAYCPQAFTRRALLMRHKSVHVKSKGYSCKHCEKWFACKSSMDRHTRMHTGEKPFECDQCHRRFIQKEILKRHMVTHTGLRPFKCPHCDKAFLQKLLLRQHINLKHTENPVIEKHECFLCPKTFYHASGLSRHLLVHSGVSYNCKLCGKLFNDKSAVKRHTMTVHSNSKSKINET